ncbi:MAG TPA: permease prefix domain 1-containing protein [Microbacterium sp.]|nr:permease prefix domain 1-containing protein [Microbacterium sp.]
MNTTSLTERYVDAAMRTVPEKQRDDLGTELRASIDDQVEARVGNGEPHDAAERAVLTQLGDPDKLAAGYTDRPLWLIGPRYYLTWWRLTKLLWAIVPVCAAFGVALGQTLAGASFGEIVGSVFSVALAVVVHIGFWTTLVFFIVERSAHGADAGLVSPWSPDDLPEPRQRGTGLGDLIASLVFLAVAAGAIVWDHFIGFGWTPDGWASFLAPELWPWWIGALFVLMVLEALLAISVYAKGRWDIGSATVNLFLNLTVAGGALWLLSQQQLINPEFFPAVIPADSAQTVSTVVSTVFGFGIVAIALWDTVDAFLKASRARRG